MSLLFPGTEVLPWWAVCAESLRSCLTLCDPVDCGPPGSSVHEILQARILEWVAIPSPGDLPSPGIESVSPALAGGFFSAETPGKPGGRLWVVFPGLSARCGLCLPPRLHFAHRVFCRIDMIQASHCSSVSCPRP